jgi:hypothetical protein
VRYIDGFVEPAVSLLPFPCVDGHPPPTTHQPLPFRNIFILYRTKTQS